MGTPIDEFLKMFRERKKKASSQKDRRHRALLWVLWYFQQRGVWQKDEPRVRTRPVIPVTPCLSQLIHLFWVANECHRVCDTTVSWVNAEI